MNLKFFKMNECDTMVSHLSLEETNRFYTDHYTDNEVEDVEEINPEVVTTWVEIEDEDEKDRVFHAGLCATDDYWQIGYHIQKRITLLEALKLNGAYTEPYVIASTEG